MAASLLKMTELIHLLKALNYVRIRERFQETRSAFDHQSAVARGILAYQVIKANPPPAECFESISFTKKGGFDEFTDIFTLNEYLPEEGFWSGLDINRGFIHYRDSVDSEVDERGFYQRAKLDSRLTESLEGKVVFAPWSGSSS